MYNLKSQYFMTFGSKCLEIFLQHFWRVNLKKLKNRIRHNFKALGDSLALLRPVSSFGLTPEQPTLTG